MNKSRILGAVCACIFSLGLSTTAKAVVIPAYFGMNFVSDSAGVPEVQLIDITYVGGGGPGIITAMPAFPGPTPGGNPGTGLPDGTGLVFAPTYTTVPSGDGETTATIGALVPIDWDLAPFPFPSIAITDITVDAPFVGGIWTAAFATPYIVGLIPAGPDTELLSFLAAPQGDIYDGFAGVVGNPVALATATSAPPGFEDFVDVSFGNFIFAAMNPVPVPAAVWLFGSGLLGLIGMARRKKAA
jgi:hypothetical protein